MFLCIRFFYVSVSVPVSVYVSVSPFSRWSVSVSVSLSRRFTHAIQATLMYRLIGWATLFFERMPRVGKSYGKYSGSFFATPISNLFSEICD